MEGVRRQAPPWAGLAVLRWLLALLLVGLTGTLCAQAQAPVVQALVEELHAVGLDVAHSYKVSDLYLRRDAIRLHLQHGILTFLEPVRGRITGAVFEGAGEALVLPPDRVERQQLLRFSGSPILTESFASAYFRFTDNTFAELRTQIRGGRGHPRHAPELAERWEPLLPTLNRVHSLRILLDFMQSPPLPYFYAGINGHHLGFFDILVDNRRREQVLVGQLRWEEDKRYYDVWCMFARRGASPPAPPAHISAYRLDATITPERTLEVVADLDLQASRPEQQVLVFHLSRLLQVEEVSELSSPSQRGPPRRLEFLQNATLTAEEARYRGTDVVMVVLPLLPSRTTPASAYHRPLRFRYRGHVISDVGAGVLHVGERSAWYPTLDLPAPAHYELRFRHPQALELVAVGTLRSHREEGAWKESLWVTEVPLSYAGFNLGDYEKRSFERGSERVTVFANRQLEPQLARALRPVPPSTPESMGAGRSLEPPVEIEPPRPPWRLERVGQDVIGALRYFTKLFGPVPYSPLKVSQIPGNLAQGYPGLLYLSTLSFLPDDHQIRLGLSEIAREHFSQLTPPHETAHQWWGNWVWMPDYRHQWLSEALASYSSMLYLEHQPDGGGQLRKWLERYRSNLLEEDEEGRTNEATGALVLGMRLNSSHSPSGYSSVIYNKGPWVIHMLRELLRDPETGGDEVFLGVLRDLTSRGSQEPLTTQEFQRSFEAVLPAYADLEGTGRLDWFFQQWVWDTGIPHYHLEWDARSGEHGEWHVEGTIEQSEVSDLFTMPVPVYARFGEELVRLGTVLVTDEVVAFRFPVPSDPGELLLDPYRTVLAVVD